MARKCVVKVMLSKEQREILRELSTRLGTSESEAIQIALMDYFKELNLISDSIRRSKNNGRYNQGRSEQPANSILSASLS